MGALGARPWSLAPNSLQKRISTRVPSLSVRHSKLSISNRNSVIPDMATPEDDLIDRCVKRLRELPFVDEITVDLNRQGRGADGVIRVVTPTTKKEYLIAAKRTHLTRTLAQGVIARAAGYAPTPWILFARHVGRPLARLLAEQDVNFVDLAGNCRLRVARRHFGMIEGRPPERRPQEGRGVGVPGLQLLFALLVRPALLNAPIRTVAEIAGVARATAADRLAQLEEQGFVVTMAGEKRLVEPRRILDQWLKGYETQVRPRLVIGRYRTPDPDPNALEQRVEKDLGGNLEWAWGGGAAAYRLTRYYRGPDTTVHIKPTPGFDVVKQLRALRANDGPLILMRAPGPIAFEGQQPRTANPLLVWAELLFAGDKRAREAADMIHGKYLGHLA